MSLDNPRNSAAGRSQSWRVHDPSLQPSRIEARSIAEGPAELVGGAGSQFDPDLVELFRSVRARDIRDPADVLVRTCGLRTVRGAA